MSEQCGVGHLPVPSDRDERVAQLTAGAVQAPPAWLALAGVGRDAASVVALLGAER